MCWIQKKLSCLQPFYVYTTCAESKSVSCLGTFLFPLPSQMAMCPANSITQMTIYGPVNGKYTTTVPATELLLYQSGQRRPGSGYVYKRLAGKREVCLCSHTTLDLRPVSQDLLAQDSTNPICKAFDELRGQTKQVYVCLKKWHADISSHQSM